MKWSKLKKTIESRFAPSVRGKVHLYSTQYGCQCGRAWITYEGKQIANFETILNLERIHKHHEPTNEHGHVVIEPSARISGEAMARGEFSRWDLHQACWEFLNMSLEAALTSENPVILGLAFLDQRLGKQRALSCVGEKLHPLAKVLLDLRVLEETRHQADARESRLKAKATDKATKTT
jgi:hypothetical protein